MARLHLVIVLMLLVGVLVGCDEREPGGDVTVLPTIVLEDVGDGGDGMPSLPEGEQSVSEGAGDGGDGMPSSPEGEQFVSVSRGGGSVVSSGGWHTCGLSEDGVVLCWGDNRWGQSKPACGRGVCVGEQWFRAHLWVTRGW